MKEKREYKTCNIQRDRRQALPTINEIHKSQIQEAQHNPSRSNEKKSIPFSRTLQKKSFLKIAREKRQNICIV